MMARMHKYDSMWVVIWGDIYELPTKLEVVDVDFTDKIYTSFGEYVQYTLLISHSKWEVSQEKNVLTS